MALLNDAARALISSGALGHMVTLDDDGTPQVAVVWADVQGDELVTAHLDARQRKLQNLRRDPRVAFSFEAAEANAVGLRHYLVVHGRARVEEGGAPELLHQLAQVHVGPGTDFPPMPNPPAGYLVRTTVERVTGNGPWKDGG